ncbi:MAG: hypothetical protein AB1649_19775 [Chloroflexota bacterium]
MKSHLQQVGNVLLIWMLFCSCQLFSDTTSSGAAPTSLVSSQSVATEGSVAIETNTPMPADGAEPTKGSSSNGSGFLQVDDSYPFPFSSTKMVIASSLAASPGKVWIGTLNGTIEEVVAQSGAFERSLALVPGAGEDPMDVRPVLQLTFDGQYLWALAHFTDVETYDNHPHLLAIDTDGWTVTRQWDQSLDSVEWVGENDEWIASNRVDPENFYTSPGKIWVEGHVIDARTFEVKPDAYNPGASFCAYNGKGWMWTTEWTSGEDGLYFVNADDFSEQPGQYRWPFLIHEQEFAAAQGDSFLVLAGDWMWMGRSRYEPGSVGWLDAFPSDLDELMKLSGPPVSVPLLESLENVRLHYAGDHLWVLYLGGEHGGWLYQLDPQMGKTLASLDLIGDEGRAMGDFPMDIASADDNLWIVTSQQLLRIKMP